MIEVWILVKGEDSLWLFFIASSNEIFWSYLIYWLSSEITLTNNWSLFSIWLEF